MSFKSGWIGVAIIGLGAVCAVQQLQINNITDRTSALEKRSKDLDRFMAADTNSVDSTDVEFVEADVV